jgi:hypothetical protein
MLFAVISADLESISVSFPDKPHVFKEMLDPDAPQLEWSALNKALDYIVDSIGLGGEGIEALGDRVQSGELSITIEAPKMLLSVCAQYLYDEHRGLFESSGDTSSPYGLLKTSVAVPSNDAMSLPHARLINARLERFNACLKQLVEARDEASWLSSCQESVRELKGLIDGQIRRHHEMILKTNALLSDDEVTLSLPLSHVQVTLDQIFIDIRDHQLTLSELVSRQLDERVWTTDWDVITSYVVGKSRFLWLGKSCNGAVHIHQLHDELINSEPSKFVSTEKIERYKWTIGWTHAESYTQDNKTFVIMMKALPRPLIHIHEIHEAGDTKGTVKPKSYAHELDHHADHLVTYQVDESRYVAIMSSKTGRFEVRSCLDHGTLSDALHIRSLSDEWTQVQSISIDRSPFLLLYSAWSGRVQLYSFKPDGDLDDAIHDAHTLPGCSTVEPFYLNDQACFMCVSQEGEAHFYMITLDGLHTLRSLSHVFSNQVGLSVHHIHGSSQHTKRLTLTQFKRATVMRLDHIWASKTLGLERVDEEVSLLQDLIASGK